MSAGKVRFVPQILGKQFGFRHKIANIIDFTGHKRGCTIAILIVRHNFLLFSTFAHHGGTVTVTPPEVTSVATEPFVEPALTVKLPVTLNEPVAPAPKTSALLPPEGTPAEIDWNVISRNGDPVPVDSIDTAGVVVEAVVMEFPPPRAEML